MYVAIILLFPHYYLLYFERKTSVYLDFLDSKIKFGVPAATTYLKKSKQVSFN